MTHKFDSICRLLFPLLCITGNGYAQSGIQFNRKVLTREFISEGGAIADVNRDGKPDIIAGAVWFEGPSWKQHSIFAPPGKYITTDFSNSFLNFALDINLDGWVDVIRVGLPGEEAVWYENPGEKPGLWAMHAIIPNCGNESPAFIDVDDDGRPDLLCNDPIAKQMIWMKPPASKGDTAWTRYVIAGGPGENTPGTDRYAHGLGMADMNGDGRADVIITKGWWEAPADRRKAGWTFHPATLGEDCSQMYALDLRKTGKPDLVSASAHDYGIWWHERPADDKDSAWMTHLIYDKFSESHAMAMADLNDDGQPDLVTGKRYFAHNQHDPGALDPAVLYWFEYQPGARPQWIPHLIDSDSGVGEQVLISDMNADGKKDIVIVNKKGVFLFTQQSVNNIK